MIDIQTIFDEINQKDSFKKIKYEESPISVFCGLREAGLPSIAFMTSNPPLLIESTQCIKVTQWEEKKNIYWSSFDLQAMNARTIFYALCIDLINATKGTKTDADAMLEVKNRYTVWRKMFKKLATPMSLEAYQGLFGELYFLYFYLAPIVGVENAIKSWSGANQTAKDYSLNEDWYEIKTITTGVTEIKISSLTQLESDIPGRLVAIRVERMSEEYDDGHASVDQLITLIMNKITDIGIKDEFLKKVSIYGFSADIDISAFPKYKVNSLNRYIVDDDFPRLTTKDIKHEEISKVTYTLSINGIRNFLEVDDVNN